MSKLVPIEEYRPDRNFIRVGDTVKCKPLSGRSFRGKVLRIMADEEGVVQEVEVVRLGDHAQFRTFRPDRVTRLVQTKTRVVKE